MKKRAQALHLFPLATLLAACSSQPAKPSPPVSSGTAGSGGMSSGAAGTGTAGSDVLTGLGGSVGQAGQTGGMSSGPAGTGGTAGSGVTTGPGGDGGQAAGGTGGSAVVTGSGGAAAGAGGMGGTVAVAFSRPKLVLPNKAYPSSMVNVPRASWKMDLVSPTMNDKHHHNQPTVLNGYLILNGNEEFFVWDVTDPAKPKAVTEFFTPNRCATCGGKKEGEAESHTVSFARYGNSFYEVTTSGRGVDIWNVTDLTKVVHIKSIPLEGIDYGDFTAAVWGLFWQGDTIYVGATDTGLDILDAHDPNNVTFVKRLPTSMLGNVSAGPVDAVGNILVVTTPKESGGIATLDISDPLQPVLLDAIKPSKSYIGQFYRHFVFLQSPVRAWDVLTDPTKIGTAAAPIGSLTTADSEYMSFSDNYMFLGHLRPNGGASKIDVTDPTNMSIKSRVWGRLDLGGINDDQFTIAIGNLLVMGDDQEPYAGSVIGVHAADPDTKPPVVDTIIPHDKATGQSVKSRVGISFTDNIELATVNAASFIVRPVGGQALAGKWGSRMGVLDFDPDQDLQPKTTYEVILPKGGITDLVGNAIAQDYKTTFTTQ